MGNKLRTLLTVLGVSVGIAVIIFLLGLGFGLQRLTIEKIIKSAALTSLDVSAVKNSSLKLDDTMIDKIKTISNIDIISPSISLPGQVNFDATNIDVVINGVDNQYLDMAGLKLATGALFADNSQEDTIPLVISSTSLDLLNITDYKSVLGKIVDATLYITKEGAASTETKEEKRKFKIVGVSKEDALTGYAPFNQLKAIGVQEYNEIKIKVNTTDNVDKVKEQIINLGLDVTSVSDLISQITKVFKIIQTVLAGFGIIALLIASIGMFNTMTIALLERTRSIGIMKTLGATTLTIKSLFIIEAGFIGLGGGVFGFSIGWAVSFAVSKLLNNLAMRSGADPMQIFYFPIYFVAAIIIFSFFVGLLTGVYPATRAAKLNPLDALRYE